MTIPPRPARIARLLAVLLAVSTPPVFCAPGQVFPPLTETDIASVEAALPGQATASPALPRRVLIFYRTEGFVHASIPVGRLALQRLGEKTGAYSSVASDDMAMFEPDTLRGFDAVVFLNSTGLRFENPTHRQALLDFVRSGKGVAGVHAATDNFPTWPEGQALMGGVFHGHPWNANDVVAVKNDEPAHIVNAGFGGRGFWLREEIYQMRTPPYGRDRLRVLLSLDMSRPENARPANVIRRTDGDFGISWIRTEGRGRVFYTSLGHNSDIFHVPAILRHMLDGMQFALGDLAADATPSARLQPVPVPVLAPGDKKTLQELVPRPPAPDATKEESALRATLADSAAADTALWAALDQVRRLGVVGAVPDLEKLAARPGFVDRVAVVLGSLRDPSARAALLRLCSSVPAGSRAPVAQALAAYPGGETFKRLAEIAAGPDVHDADAARETLAAFGRRESIAALASLPPSPENTRALINAASLLASRDAGASKPVIDLLRRLLADAGLPPSLRVEGLSALDGLDSPAARATAEAWLTDADRRVRQAAATLLASRPEPAGVEMLARKWSEMPVDVRVALLAACDQAESLPLVRLAVVSEDPLVQEAGARAAARLGDLHTLLSMLPRLAAKDRSRDWTRLALATADAPGLVDRLRAAAAESDEPAMRSSLLGLLADRYDREALPLVLAACASDVDELRAGGFSALATLSAPGDLAAVLEVASRVKKGAERRDWRRALFGAAAMHPSAGEAADLIAARLRSTSDANERPVLIGALTLTRSPEATAVLEQMLAAQEPDARKSVIRALSAARGQESLDLLMKVAAGDSPEDERILALRGAVETVPTLENVNASSRVERFRKLWPLAFRQEEKDSIIAAVRQIRDRSANRFLDEFAAPAATKPETAEKPTT